MPSKSKQKGGAFERELVKALEARGLKAQKAWGSNGEALGELPGVDLIFYDSGGFRWRVQAKRRAKLPSYLLPPEGADIVMMREDRGETMVVIPLSRFIEML